MTLEYLVLIAFFMIQIWISFSIWQAIKQMDDTFQAPYELLKISSETEHEISTEQNFHYFTLSSTSNNTSFKEIKDTINRYLEKNNQATIDFHLLKDIVERNIEAQENDITGKLTAPLYIGLAASMFGIISGLWSINSFDISLDTITPFLSSIKWAMSVSISGLLLTLLLSVFIFRKSKTQVDFGKHRFLSFLQTELLPKFSKSNESEISRLNHKLDAFARQSSNWIENLRGMVDKTAMSLKHEQEILHNINEIDLQKVSKFNMEVFSQLQKMMTSFEAFPLYYQQLNGSLSQTTTLNESLLQLLEQKELLPNVLEKLTYIIESTKDATDFFNANIESFGRYGSAVREAVSSADDKMQTAIEQLIHSISTQLNAYQTAATNYQDKIDQAFQNSVDKYSETVDLQVTRMNQAFEEATPHFAVVNEIRDALLELNKNVLSQTDAMNKMTAGTKNINDRHLAQQALVNDPKKTSKNSEWWSIKINRKLSFWLLFFGLPTLIVILYFLRK